MKVLCEHRRRQTAPSGPKGRTSAVSADVDRLLRPKTLDQLNVLERQIDAKLQSNEPIDVEYWEDLLESIGVYKAKAQLRGIYQSVLKSRLRAFKQQQLAEAISVQARMNAAGSGASAETPYSISLDPEPMLKVPAEDKALKVLDESEFLASVVSCVLIATMTDLLKVTGRRASESCEDMLCTFQAAETREAECCYNL